MSEPATPCARAHLLAELDPGSRTRCEIYSRVMGYHRPVSAWNSGKQQEYRDRTQFREAAAGRLRGDE
jgi:hypothetical protein